MINNFLSYPFLYSRVIQMWHCKEEFEAYDPKGSKANLPKWSSRGTSDQCF